MDRFNELEKAWERRQKKRRITVGVILALGIAVFALNQWDKTKIPNTAQEVETTPKPPLKAAATPVATQPEATVPVPTPPPQKKQPPAVKKPPMLLVLDRSFETSIRQQIAQAPVQTDPSPVADEETVPPDTTGGEKAEITTEAVAPDEKSALLIEKFNLDESYENALDVARFFLDTGMHQEARDWALKANTIESADEQSWLVFAQASIALGEKEQAKEALESYLQKSDSFRIRQLYNQLREEP